VDTDELRARVKAGLEKRVRRAELKEASATKSRNSTKDREKVRASTMVKTGEFW
jgi:hypothetical protein